MPHINTLHHTQATATMSDSCSICSDLSSWSFSTEPPTTDFTSKLQQELQQRYLQGDDPLLDVTIRVTMFDSAESVSSEEPPAKRARTETGKAAAPLPPTAPATPPQDGRIIAAATAASFRRVPPIFKHPLRGFIRRHSIK